MILQTVSDLRLDPARCVIVGDQMSDIEAGTAVGLGLRILPEARPGKPSPQHPGRPALGAGMLGSEAKSDEHQRGKRS
jgi:histidinol phosphatase-like enzyme